MPAKRTKESRDFYIDIGKKIKKYRINGNYTQKELADYLGVSQNNIAGYEYGDIAAPSYMLFKIAEFFKVPISYLFPLSPKDELKEFIAENKDVISKLVDNIEAIKSLSKFKEE